MTTALQWWIRSAVAVAAPAGMEQGVFALLRLHHCDDDCALTARRRVAYTHSDSLSRFGVEHLGATLATCDRQLFVVDRDETTGDLVCDLGNMLHRLLPAVVRPTQRPQPAPHTLTTAERSAR